MFSPVYKTLYMSVRYIRPYIYIYILCSVYYTLYIYDVSSKLDLINIIYPVCYIIYMCSVQYIRPYTYVLSSTLELIHMSVHYIRPYIYIYIYALSSIFESTHMSVHYIRPYIYMLCPAYNTEHIIFSPVN
jgi:hypothetical protein